MTIMSKFLIKEPVVTKLRKSKQMRNCVTAACCNGYLAVHLLLRIGILCSV